MAFFSFYKNFISRSGNTEPVGFSTQQPKFASWPCIRHQLSVLGKSVYFPEPLFSHLENKANLSPTPPEQILWGFLKDDVSKAPASFQLGKGISKCNFPCVFPFLFTGEMGPFCQLFVLFFVLTCER